MNSADLSGTPRTPWRRHRERGRSEREDLYAVLDAGLICHLGVLVHGAPRLLPTGYGRLDDTLYLHGSSANSTFMAGGGRGGWATASHSDRPGRVPGGARPPQVLP